MYLWFGLALVAYLLGATIEGVSTASDLLQLMPELLSGGKARSLESQQPPAPRGRIVAVILSVSLVGAVFWPCRLLHRSLKAPQKD